MSVISLRPVGWDRMTPKQWGILREMIGRVHEIALRNCNTPLLMRAEALLSNTEGYDV